MRLTWAFYWSVQTSVCLQRDTCRRSSCGVIYLYAWLFFFVIHDELFHGRYESLWRGSLNQAGVAWLPGAYRTDIHVYSRVSNPKTFGLLVTRTNFHVCKWSLCTKFRRDPPSSCLGFEGIPQWIGYCSVKSKHHLVSLAPLFGSNYPNEPLSNGFRRYHLVQVGFSIPTNKSSYQYFSGKAGRWRLFLRGWMPRRIRHAFVGRRSWRGRAQHWRWLNQQIFAFKHQTWGYHQPWIRREKSSNIGHIGWFYSKYWGFLQISLQPLGKHQFHLHFGWFSHWWTKSTGSSF